MSSVTTLAIIVAIAFPVTLWRAYRPNPGLVARWAGDRGLQLTAESHALVDRYLRRARVYRAWGLMAGALAPTVVAYLADGRVTVLGFSTDGDSAPLTFGAIFVGYLAGALCAEVATVRRGDGPQRVASLVPRELPSYLPRGVLLAQRIAAVAAAAGTLALAPLTPLLILAALLTLGFGAGLEALERWFVVRPQPFVDPALIAADDAIRAQSICAVAGAGLAVLLLLCCGIAAGLQAPAVAAVCFVAALVAYTVVGEAPWRVARAASA